MVKFQLIDSHLTQRQVNYLQKMAAKMNLLIFAMEM